ncbi:MAG: helix-hairpin-helix domain-containing protein [Planctomycetota bacterium]
MIQPRDTLRLGDALLLGAILTTALFAWLAPTEPSAADLAEACAVTIDVRLAGEAEWRALPGIGPTHARALAKASEAGLLNTAQDILRVDGIGPKTLAKLQPFLEPVR